MEFFISSYPVFFFYNSVLFFGRHAHTDSFTSPSFVTVVPGDLPFVIISSRNQKYPVYYSTSLLVFFISIIWYGLVFSDAMLLVATCFSRHVFVRTIYRDLERLSTGDHLMVITSGKNPSLSTYGALAVVLFSALICY